MLLRHIESSFYKTTYIYLPCTVEEIQQEILLFQFFLIFFVFFCDFDPLPGDPRPKTRYFQKLRSIYKITMDNLFLAQQHSFTSKIAFKDFTHFLKKIAVSTAAYGCEEQINIKLNKCYYGILNHLSIKQHISTQLVLFSLKKSSKKYYFFSFFLFFRLLLQFSPPSG